LNAVTGRQGLISFVQLQQSERDLIAQRTELAHDAAVLRGRIRELADASLDTDALEEAAHRQIGAARNDEMVFELAQSPVTKTQ
jgi:cell division protein FtsB